MSTSDWLLLSNNVFVALDCLITGLVLREMLRGRREPPPPPRDGG